MGAKGWGGGVAGHVDREVERKEGRLGLVLDKMGPPEGGRGSAFGTILSDKLFEIYPPKTMSNSPRKKRGLNPGSGMALGVGIGTAVGVATDNLGLWLALGIAIGAALGFAGQAKNSD